MLAELRLTLECPKLYKLHFNKASLLHGVLMQTINSEYADELHKQGLKPYSQAVRCERDKAVWHVRTFSAKAYEQIILPLQADTFHEFYLEHDDTCIKIKDKEEFHCEKSSLIKTFYAEEADRYYTIEFMTPTAFKKEGRYYFFPNIYNIYYSLMQKYDASSSQEIMGDSDTLEQLEQHTEIVSYNLHSISFFCESVRIPAFMGQIGLRISGPQTMVNFAKLLFRFGEFSGIGIKTAMGMGMMRMTEGKRKENK